MRDPVTIRDIAAHLGISHATVSRVLNGKGADFISEATRKRVLAAAEELGYRRNYHARALHIGRADAIGIAMLTLPHTFGYRDFWGLIVDGVAEAAALAGKELVAIGSERPHEDVIERCLLRLQERRIDCLVLPGIFDLRTWGKAFREARAPVVVAQAADDAAGGLTQVRLDSEPGIRAAVEHLAGLGHRRIAWFGPKPDQGEPKRRRAVYRAAMAKLGLTTREFIADEPGSPAGDEPWVERAIAAAKDGAAAAVAGTQRPTAVVCYNERMAQGLWAAATDAGLRVPRDLSLIGFDDIHAEFSYPAMTVVSHRLNEIGKQAAELALAMSVDGVGEAREVKVPAELIVRRTTAAPRAG